MNKSKFHSIFPIEILTTFIDTKIADSVEKIVTPRLNKLKKGGNVSTDYHEKTKIITPSEFPDLAKEMGKCLMEYSDNTGAAIGHKIDHWVQDYQIGENHPRHAHPNSSLSGVYFVRANEHAGVLQLMNPNPHTYFQKYFNENSNQNLYFDIKPQKGLLVIFPSYLFHQALHSENKNCIRTCIAFNVDIYNEK